MPASRPNSKKRAPTMPPNLRQATAVLIQSKLPGIGVSWNFGHASFEVNGKVFCFITREGALAMKLPAERIEAMVGDGDVRNLKMGERTMREWVVVPVEEETAFASLKLLREARAYVESIPATTRKRATKKISASKKAAKKAAGKKD